MKLRVMLYGLTLMLGCFVLASCINDGEGPCLPDGETRVLFKLVLQDNAQTRAAGETWGNYSPKKAGEGYDNQIDLANVQFLLFKSDGSYAGKLTDLTYTIPGDPRYDFVYDYVGTAPTDLVEGDYKFVVLANCPEVTPTNLEALNTLAFDYLGGDDLPNIPMWGTKGVTTDTHLKPEPGARKDIGAISLLRAVSKVTVRLSGADTDIRNYKLEKVEVEKYNTKGYVVPTNYATVTETTAHGVDASLHANTSAGEALLTPELTNDKEVTFYLPEYVNSTTAPAEVMVYLTKEVTSSGVTKTVKFAAPVQFCKYADGVPATGTDAELYNIIRNHYYEFNITKVTDDGALYVKPTVAPWIDADELDYTINMSTSMRLFDSWLYRIDTDNDLTVENYTDWATSHLMVSSGVEAASATIPVAGRPLRSPQIQLVTTGRTSSVANAFELYVDNSDFEIVSAVKDDTGKVTAYVKSTDGTLNIAGGENVYTYFYIVPKEGVTPANPEAKVFLYYNDSALGKLKTTFNNNALPGYSDDSSEIWAYYVAPDDYKYVAGKVLKMYYQDEHHPIVPTSDQN